MNAVDLLDEQLPARRTSEERWGRGLTDEEKAARAAAYIKRTCGKCGSFWTGTFADTERDWLDHAKKGCR